MVVSRAARKTDAQRHGMIMKVWNVVRFASGFLDASVAGGPDAGDASGGGTAVRLLWSPEEALLSKPSSSDDDWLEDSLAGRHGNECTHNFVCTPLVLCTLSSSSTPYSLGS
jgi:hypothetical protein